MKPLVAVAVAAAFFAGADAFQPCALTPATLRAPRAAAMKHAAMRIARQGTSRVFMAATDEDSIAKAKAAAQRAEQFLSTSFADMGAEPGNKENEEKISKLDDSKLQGLLRKKTKTEQKTEQNEEEDEEGEADAAEALRAKMRMETFEAQLKEVRDRKTSGKSKEELDVRGVRIGASTGEEREWLEEPQVEKKKKNKLEEMDAKLKQVLRGDVEKKKMRDDRLRTETGEELLYAEFAPGAEISSFALPDNFDPLSPPLPSELKRMRELSEKQARGENVEVEDMLPMPSKLASPSKKAELYKQSSVGIEDDSLFSIKSVFDQDAKVPGRTVSREERKARDKAQQIPMGKEDVGSLDDILARDRAALRDLKKLASEESAAGKKESVGESVSKVMGIVVIADFFVVIGFLGWLVVSIVYQYAVCGGLTPETGPVCANPVYDSWYALWTPVIQPALGILMASVILERTVKAILPKGD